MTQKPFTITLKETEEYQPLLEGKPQTRGMRSGRVFLKPNESCGEHTTGDHEEQLVFFAGQGTAYWGPEKNAYEVGVGKIIYIPPHTLHDIHNTGNEPLVYIYCVAPAAGEENE
jgi:mannose-6-phosphate isomerase-like protein (cupin superfamily)